ncbi:unnamed protein product [Polarella glacialis]|uniref:Uncharacterized protein n=1 Tax=Polarella glacialis TaxID=89957 RepID=A0A813JI27_POLGL|nr:unnamed protein product [Polarella glacialis]
MLFGLMLCLLAAVWLVAARPDLARGLDVGAEALAADDECQIGGVGCALDALQRSWKLGAASRNNTEKNNNNSNSSNSSNSNNTEKIETAVVPGTCNATNPCVHPDRCLSDGTWAQCVPTSASSFEKQCVKWTDRFRYTAIRLMKLNCPNTKCYSNEWCLDGMVCAAQSDGGWAQCISCGAKYFQTSCYSWSTPFKIAAGKVCARKCKHGWSDATLSD